MEKTFQKKIKIIFLLLLLGAVVSALIFVSKNHDNIKKEDKELLDKIGQMLIIGFRGTEVLENSEITKTIRDLNIGGVILFDFDVPSKSFPRNIKDPEQTRELIANLQIYAKTPLFVAVDAEGGLINRLKEKYGFIAVPSAQEMGQTNDPQETKETVKNLALELSQLGFNLNFAPVVDININSENPIIGELERSFSDDPEKVTAHALAFIEAHHQYNIITALKHFPGHGSSHQDSHKGMADITDTYQEKELIPYEKIIKKGEADIIMTAHIINRNIDPEYPASISPLFIENILRQELGFEGIVVSDDMQMGAISEYFGFEEAIIKAINAGNDILVISNNNEEYDELAAHKARDIIFQAVKDKKIDQEQIIKSSNRILNLKKRFKIIQ